MFIYKITIIPLNQVYIGFDTGDSYKLKRWKIHCRNAFKNFKTKLYKAMAEYGLENCKVEIVEDNFTSMVSLALAEIHYIKKYNSYESGLNSTRGGDGFGRHNLHLLSNEEINLIKKALGENFKNYNKNIKWSETSAKKRKELTKHLHTEEIYKKKSETLKKFYENNPSIKKYKGSTIKKWQEENRNKLKETNRSNGLIGAAKVSKKLQVDTIDGKVLYFNSKSEFHRQTGQWAETVLKKSKNGEFHNGYKAKEV